MPDYRIPKNALELIATFSRHGIALDRDQQQAVVKLCRAAKTIRRYAEMECNGPTNWAGDSIFLAPEGWAQWERGVAASKERASDRARACVNMLPHVIGVLLGGDPRGCTVKLVMDKAHEHMHDDWGREGLCVPGS